MQATSTSPSCEGLAIAKPVPVWRVSVLADVRQKKADLSLSTSSRLRFGAFTLAAGVRKLIVTSTEASVVPLQITIPPSAVKVNPS